MLSTPKTRRPARRVLLALAGLLAWGQAGPASAEIAEVRRTPIVRAVQSARPAVVNIQGQKSVDDAAAAGAKRQVNGMGTGVVIDPRGYILTNHHVVDGVRQIRVTLDGGARHLARIVAHDRRTDLAVIKIDAGRRLPTIPVGRSSDLMPGETVVAVGNAYGYEHTVTRGIVSALGRDVQVSETQAYDDLIQTDASINPGNSGGPLLSIEGKMIGLNVAVRAGAQGIGFAIPVDDALDVAARLVSVERLESKWHGLETAASSDGESLVVRRVASGSPAAAGGVRPGDVIQRLGDVDVARRLDVERALLGRPVGERVSMRVVRSGRPVDLRLAVTRRGVIARNSPVQRASAQATGRDEKLASQAWELLGMRLDQASSERFADGRTQYRGGMRVIDVRRDGPAAAKGIRAGDVLVGMHIWETVSDEDLRYIVNNDSIAEMDAVKFFVLRGDETLWGKMRVAAKPTTRR